MEDMIFHNYSTIQIIRDKINLYRLLELSE